MKVPGLRSSYEKVGGIVYFGRMLDKIRLHAHGKLPSDYNRGTGFDGRCVRFLHVDYDPRWSNAHWRAGLDDRTIGMVLSNGAACDHEEEILVWNAFLTKRGWRDEASEDLRLFKEKRGFAHRDDIQTFCDFHKADEAED